jgi:putative glutamine amidotransferase
MKKEVTIGITDCSKYENYRKWFAGEEGVTVVKLSYDDNNLDDLPKCDGIVLSGGEDVHPRFYKKDEYLELCHEINEKRDEFEWRVLEYCENSKLPLFGICRGLQIANVFYGGTLIPHIPAFGKFDHSMNGASDRYHNVTVDSNSQLREIVGTISGETNSAHHQSADRIGSGLVANALSADGIVEGIEREHANDKPYLQLVQWHPERMTDLESPFSKNLKQTFLVACR